MLDVSQYKDIFLIESKEHLLTLNASLLELENNPESLSPLNEIFRSVHTIKGMAATMGYRNITELSHEMENVLDKLRKKEAALLPKVIDTLFLALDLLENIIEGVTNEDDNKEIDVNPVLIHLKNIFQEKEAKNIIHNEEVEQIDSSIIDKGLEIDDSLLEQLQSFQEQKQKIYLVEVRLMHNCVLKSARAFMVFQELEKIGEILRTFPLYGLIMEENFDLDFKVLFVTDNSLDVIQSKVEAILEIDKVSVIPHSIENKKLISNLKDDDDEVSQEELVTSQRKIDYTFKKTKNVRIAVERLDNLAKQIGELIITKGRLVQLSTVNDIPELTEVMTRLVRLSDELQDEIMKARMVPIGYIFERFPRIVRDTAKQLGKEVVLVMEGKEIELDRSIIDQIGEPLVHILRNSVDHGIEFPEERQKLDKPHKGTIRLVAERNKSNVTIIVEDDGGGINREAIRQTALRIGLYTKEELNAVDDRAILMLITHPGFSTVKNVTDLSGRGVGMDVVRTKIRSLGGIIEINSRIKEGTKITLKLPLTLAVIQAMMLRIGEEVYALPLNYISETLEYDLHKIKTIKNRLVIMTREGVLPLVDLGKLLNVPNYNKSSIKREKSIVVVEINNEHIGILVDALLGQEEIVIKPLDPILSDVPGFSGITIKGDGLPALVLDIASIV